MPAFRKCSLNTNRTIAILKAFIVIRHVKWWVFPWYKRKSSRRLFKPLCVSRPVPILFALLKMAPDDEINQMAQRQQACCLPVVCDHVCQVCSAGIEWACLWVSDLTGKLWTRHQPSQAVTRTRSFSNASRAPEKTQAWTAKTKRPVSPCLSPARGVSANWHSCIHWDDPEPEALWGFHPTLIY